VVVLIISNISGAIYSVQLSQTNVKLMNLVVLLVVESGVMEATILMKNKVMMMMTVETVIMMMTKANKMMVKMDNVIYLSVVAPIISLSHGVLK